MATATSYFADRRNARKAEGVCIDCAKPSAPHSYCTKCRKRRATAAQRKRDRIKAGA